ncbi:leukemia NUP98 fusion partner 1 [Elgaria multicarinata webbii]|uniref:leukemia NUP98 fusion partner 1 n=1 Tax=Elgaria multicarinata webbii TaxID=159646 RepID=UPI002FCCE387
MDYEEDDDISFAKWMSSFWGHSVTDEKEKESRAHKKHQERSLGERRASLPAKLSSIHTRLHASAKIPSPGHLKGCKELRKDQDTKCHCHTKACKKSLNGHSSQGTSGPNSRSNSIQEFSESFERQLHFKNKRSVSLEPEGMKERREREKLHIPKSRSHKKTGEKKELKTEQEEGEHYAARQGSPPLKSVASSRPMGARSVHGGPSTPGHSPSLRFGPPPPQCHITAASAVLLLSADRGRLGASGVVGLLRDGLLLQPIRRRKEAKATNGKRRRGGALREKRPA